MTSREKGAETLKRHKEAQRQRDAQERNERELIRKSLTEVLESSDATPAQKLESSKLLLQLQQRG